MATPDSPVTGHNWADTSDFHHFITFLVVKGYTTAPKYCPLKLSIQEYPRIYHWMLKWFLVHNVQGKKRRRLGIKGDVLNLVSRKRTTSGSSTGSGGDDGHISPIKSSSHSGSHSPFSMSPALLRKVIVLVALCSWCIEFLYYHQTDGKEGWLEGGQKRNTRSKNLMRFQ